jgi:hypothetical protein
MPASVADPVALVLRTALSGKKGPYSHETENAPELLEDRLAASAKRVLLSSIEYEPAPKQQLLSLDTLKSKYTVLNSSLSAKITSLNGIFISSELFLSLINKFVTYINDIQCRIKSCDNSRFATSPQGHPVSK